MKEHLIVNTQKLAPFCPFLLHPLTYTCTVCHMDKCIKLERHFSSNDKFLRLQEALFRTLILPFVQNISETTFLNYIIYLGLYSLKSHDKQVMLNLNYEWFLIIDGETEKEGELKAGIEACQSGRMAGGRTVSYPH